MEIAETIAGVEKGVRAAFGVTELLSFFGGLFAGKFAKIFGGEKARRSLVEAQKDGVAGNEAIQARGFGLGHGDEALALENGLHAFDVSIRQIEALRKAGKNAEADDIFDRCNAVIDYLDSLTPGNLEDFRMTLAEFKTPEARTRVLLRLINSIRLLRPGASQEKKVEFLSKILRDFGVEKRPLREGPGGIAIASIVVGFKKGRKKAKNKRSCGRRGSHGSTITIRRTRP